MQPRVRAISSKRFVRRQTHVRSLKGQPFREAYKSVDESSLPVSGEVKLRAQIVMVKKEADTKELENESNQKSCVRRITGLQNLKMSFLVHNHRQIELRYKRPKILKDVSELPSRTRGPISIDIDAFSRFSTFFVDEAERANDRNFVAAIDKSAGLKPYTAIIGDRLVFNDYADSGRIGIQSNPLQDIENIEHL